MKLRRATATDASFLFRCRNDPVTRAMSVNSGEIAWSDHVAWLNRTLIDSTRHLLIADRGGIPLGTVRFDTIDDYQELSWCVSPKHRGKGVGREMIRLGGTKFSGKLIALIKPENLASQKIATSAGFAQTGMRDGLIEFVRDPVNP